MTRIGRVYANFVRFDSCKSAQYQKGVIRLIAVLPPLLDEYTRWRKDKTVLRQIDDWVVYLVW